MVIQYQCHHRVTLSTTSNDRRDISVHLFVQPLHITSHESWEMDADKMIIDSKIIDSKA